MIIVHHLEQSRSQRILWLLEELGLAYEIKHYKRDPQTSLAPPALKAVHPLGKSPVIEDDASGQALIIAETGAIVEYLIDLYGQDRFKPAAGTAESLRYRYWLHYAEGSLMTPLLLKLFMTRMAEAPMPFFAKPVAKGLTAKVLEGYVEPNLTTHFDFIEGELSKSTFLAGNDLTGADIMMSFPIEGGTSRGNILDGRPKLRDYLTRLQNRPAYLAALEKGGPYIYGPAV